MVAISDALPLKAACGASSALS